MTLMVYSYYFTITVGCKYFGPKLHDTIHTYIHVVRYIHLYRLLTDDASNYIVHSIPWYICVYILVHIRTRI